MAMLRHDRGRVAVFVASSDNTRDVFERVFPSLLRHWPTCPYSIFAGFNRIFERPLGFTPLYAPATAWGSELAIQLKSLSADYVILFLDDFLLLKDVNSVLLDEVVSAAINHGLDYLRLTRVRRPLLPSFLRNRSRSSELFEAVPITDPYYSSLQVALWKKAHLLQCLENEGDIWKFERVRPMTGCHYAVRKGEPIRYRHVVEKGRWLPDARRLLRAAGIGGDLGTRARWPQTYQVRRWLALARFEFVGYSVMRYKDALKRRRLSGLSDRNP